MSGATAFLAGLLGGGVQGYQMRRAWDRQDEQDALTKEERQLRIGAARRKAEDDAEMRSAMVNIPDAPAALPAERGRTAVLAAFGDAPGGPAEPRPATLAEQPRNADGVPVAEQIASRQDIGRQAAVGIIAAPQAGPRGFDQALRGGRPFDADAWLEKTGPQILTTLMRQGRIDEAKKFSDFADSREGRAYSKTWAHGVRQLSLGDVTGALGRFEKLYNDELPDGHTVKPSPLGGASDGYTISQYDASGRLIGSRQGSAV